MAILSQNKQTQCYCAFCKSQRKVYTKKSLDFMSYVGLLALSLTIMLILAQDFDPRVIIFFVLSLIFCEAVVHFRWRLTMVCRHCGFDPILYLRSPEKAAQKVKDQLIARRDNVDTIFAQPLNLPVKKVRRDDRPGSNVSRHA